MRSLLFFLITLSSAIAKAAPVPQPESTEEIERRISAAKSAAEKDVIGQKGSLSIFRGLPFVVTVYGSGQEPWTDAIRRAHSIFATRKPPGGSDQYIINLDIPDMITGVQFFRKGTRPTADAKQSAEAWLDAHFTYNGASEAGLIDMTRWCRRGGSYQMPRACDELSTRARQKGLWNRTAQ